LLCLLDLDHKLDLPPLLPYRRRDAQHRPIEGLEARRTGHCSRQKQSRRLLLRQSRLRGSLRRASAGIDETDVLPGRGGYEGGGVAGAARLSVLSRRLREPETGRGVMVFCWVVVGKRSVLRLIVEELVRCCGGFATLSDSRGAQRRLRLEIEGFPSPMVLGNGRETRSAGLPPVNKAARMMGIVS
ncbi:hypothetical protein B0H14DRAFT_2829528, partial [Mycena olivaceomarginata]